jgi:hypothetical protein
VELPDVILVNAWPTPSSGPFAADPRFQRSRRVRAVLFRGIQGALMVAFLILIP